ncbi:uncharacterized protein LOC115768098 [Drosophila novamexicana]|uniref:uncharacterized protein LOC115768098 n=1 Tax=Drosophila novamexicana TaxID=47314 RepID=UPI0011E5D39C|nr:uncharacterized protein LOC115768098 [Drosophila novamexicana]
MATGYSSTQLQTSRSDERIKAKRGKDKRSDENQDWNARRNQSRSITERSSQTSLRRNTRLQSQSRFCVQYSDDDSYETVEELLNTDFNLLLAVTPKPEEVFCPKSSDYQLAMHWYKKLSTWKCETLNDLRLRQVYMSHLSVCFNQKRLRGIFMQIPPNELILVDFMEASESLPCCTSTSMVNTSAWQTMATMMQQQPERATGSCCNQAAKANESHGIPVGGPRSAGGSNKRRCSLRPAHKITCKSRPKLVPRYFADAKQNLYSSSGSSVSCAYAPVTATPQLNKNQHGAGSIRYSSHSRPLDEQARKDMNYLLETIKSELCGQDNQNTDEHLELELRRYRDFYARHRHNDPEFKVNVAAGPEKERTFMLLNMQNDLVKLLSE